VTQKTNGSGYRFAPARERRIGKHFMQQSNYRIISVTNDRLIRVCKFTQSAANARMTQPKEEGTQGIAKQKRITLADRVIRDAARPECHVAEQPITFKTGQTTEKHRLDLGTSEPFRDAAIVDFIQTYIQITRTSRLFGRINSAAGDGPAVDVVGHRGLREINAASIFSGADINEKAGEGNHAL
jgi:hypothetical protein